MAAIVAAAGTLVLSFLLTAINVWAPDPIVRPPRPKRFVVELSEGHALKHPENMNKRMS